LEQKKETFPVTDVRELTGNFLPMILHRAQQVNLHNGICIVQSFEPKPLYSALRDWASSMMWKKFRSTNTGPTFTGRS